MLKRLKEIFKDNKRAWILTNKKFEINNTIKAKSNFLNYEFKAENYWPIIIITYDKYIFYQIMILIKPKHKLIIRFYSSKFINRE